jgi:hypothetical protein
VLNFVDLNGNLLLMTAFGDKGFGTLEPKTPRAELISWTGITQNVDGSATLTGVTRNLRAISPYDQVSITGFQHAGGTSFVVSNTPAFYNEMSSRDNDETITGIYTFTNPNVPRMDVQPTYGAGTEEYLATKEYVDNVAIAGAPDASTTQKGIVQEATQAQVDARTATGSTGARTFVNPATVRATLYSDYAVDSVGTDSYAIAPTPAVTAYTAGQVFTWKAGTANTGASSLNVSGLGAVAIKKNVSEDTETGDILANQTVVTVYDGTNFQLVSGIPGAATSVGVQNSSYVYATDSVGTDAYAITLTPAPAAYATGQKFIFKAGAANTGACSLNVNALGAVAIKKNITADLENNDIKSGQMVEVAYDGTNFQLVSPIAVPVQRFKGTITRVITDASGSQAITGVGFTPKKLTIVSGAQNFSDGSINYTATSRGDSIAGGSSQCEYVSVPSGSASSGTQAAYVDTTNIVRVFSSNNSAGQVATLTSLDSDGFTLNWTKTGLPTGGNMLTYFIAEA